MTNKVGSKDLFRGRGEPEEPGLVRLAKQRPKGDMTAAYRLVEGVNDQVGNDLLKATDTRITEYECP